MSAAGDRGRPIVPHGHHSTLTREPGDDDGEVAEITNEGAYEHIVHQASDYRGRAEYQLKPG